MMLTKKEVAKLLSVSTCTVDTLVRDGKLTCYKVGRLCRYVSEDVEACLQAIKYEPPKRPEFRAGNVKYVPGMKLV